MSSTLRRAPALALAVALCAAAPAAAQNHAGPPGGGAVRGSVAPVRVTQQARLAVRAVDRAGERIDDGETAKAVSQLASARRHLASAQKSALKRLSTDAAPASVSVVLDAEASVATQAAGLFDGQDGATVDAIAQTLDAALDARDATIAAVTALDDTAEADYADAYGQAADAIADEISAYDDALSDDTLTDAAKAALTSAKTKATATKAALDARVTALGSASDSAGPAGPGDCPPGRHGGAPEGGGPGF